MSKERKLLKKVNKILLEIERSARKLDALNDELAAYHISTNAGSYAKEVKAWRKGFIPRALKFLETRSKSGKRMVYYNENDIRIVDG